MRLIDADTLFDFIQKEKAWKQDTMRCPRYDQGKYDAFYEMLEIIKRQPTVDAVPVVRCGECKYGWKNGERSCGGTWVSTFHCDKRNCDMLTEDFCNYGERKDGEK